MEQLVEFTGALIRLFTQPDVFFSVIVGTSVGLMLGAIPGLTSTVGIVLLIPFTFYMSPLAAVSMVYAVHKASNYGGSIPAILLHTPGTPAAACTQLDGYPLTLQGKRGKALKTAVISSAIADFFSDMVLVFATVYIAQWVWKFGPVEMAAVLFFSITIIGTVTGKSVVKGLISAFAGLVFATVGLDPMSWTPRFTAGMIEFEKGLSLVPLLIGVFIVSEVFVQIESSITGGDETIRESFNEKSTDPADQKVSLRELWSLGPTILRSYIIGQIIGIIPGLGGGRCTLGQLCPGKKLFQTSRRVWKGKP